MENDLDELAGVTVREEERKRIVEVIRDWDGQVFSQVRIDTEKQFQARPIVIDRAGRHLSNETVIARAKALADLLELEYREDLTWRCNALRKLRCHCPDCISKGRS